VRCKNITPVQIVYTNVLLLRLWAFAHCFLCGAPYTKKRGDLSPYALLGRFLPRLRPLLGAASFF
jgi:hypothetical protein